MLLKVQSGTFGDLDEETATSRGRISAHTYVFMGSILSFYQYKKHKSM